MVAYVLLNKEQAVDVVRHNAQLQGLYHRVVLRYVEPAVLYFLSKGSENDLCYGVFVGRVGQFCDFAEYRSPPLSGHSDHVYAS